MRATSLRKSSCPSPQQFTSRAQIVLAVFESGSTRSLRDVRRIIADDSNASLKALVTRKCERFLPNSQMGEMNCSATGTMPIFTICSARLPKWLKRDVATNTWEAFWQTNIENQPVASVASKLKMSVASVYKARRRVLKRIQQQVEFLEGSVQ